MNDKKCHSYILVSVIIVAVFVLVFMIVRGVEPFGDNTFVNEDCISYIYPYLVVFYDKLKSGDSLLYYWNGSLGDSFLPNYFYLISSPFNFLVVLVRREDIRSFINITIALRVVLSSGAFSLYLSKDNTEFSKNIFIIPLSCAYALSGFVLGYYHESMWLDSYMIFPVIMYGYNRMIRLNKPVVYILSLAYSAICSIFMTFMIGIFLILWFVLDRHDSFKQFAHKGIRFLLFSFFSAGLAAFPILITGNAILDSRIGDSTSLMHEWFGNIFCIIRNHFFLSVPIQTSYHNYANVYCGTFVIVMVFMYLFVSNISHKDRIKKIGLLLFLLVSMNESILNYIWHGFHFQNGVPNRFSFLYIFLLLVISKSVLDNKIDMKKSLVAMFLSEVLVFASYFFMDFDSFIGSRNAFVVSMVIIFIYSVFVIASNGSEKKTVDVIFAFLMIAELLCHSFISLDFIKSVGTYYDDVYSSVENVKRDVFTNDGDELVRTRVLGMASKNNELAMNLNGVGAFNVFQNRDVVSFLDKCGYFSTIVSIEDRGGYKPIDDILGVRRIITLEDDYNAFLNNTEIYCDGNIHVYENDKSLPLGYGINDDDDLLLEDYDYFENINRIADNMTGVQGLLRSVYPIYNIGGEGYLVNMVESEELLAQCYPIEGVAEPYLKLSFGIEESGIYNMKFGYENISKVTVFVNGDIRRKDRGVQTDGILCLGQLEQGDNVEVMIENSGFAENGETSDGFFMLNIGMSILDDDNYVKFINVLKQSEMKTSVVSSGLLRGEVTIGADQLLFTSIPFDKGWHVYDNGNELEKSKYANSFIGIHLSEGKHELTFRYIPAGFYAGIAISLISWLAFLVLVCIGVQKKTDV